MPDALFLEIVAPTGANAKAPAAELPRQGKLIVGANGDRASFVVEGQGVADVHCAIGRIKGGGWALKDLGSEFGTRVNGKRVETARLAAGDEILIGSRKLRVFDPAAESGSARAAAPASNASAAADWPPAASEARAEAPSAERSTTSSTPEASPESTPGSTQGMRSPAPAVPAQKPAPADALELAGYRLERPLGRGAMGDVFLATQSSLDRKVALKILRKELGKDATFVQRFRDEARAAARLNHPNVVTVYDVGEDKGRHYLSMEFMDGESVESRLARGGPLPWREALDVMRDAAAGLVYAESNGIVHRDIKPDNLMRNAEGVTKIADLGLAVQVEQESVDSGSGRVFGTPHFIAPEVVRGAPADARSDMFSLGATAYRILSGRTPFEGSSTREILRALLNEEPAPLGTLVPGLPAGIEAVVHRLLAKSPDARYASAAILLRELERLRQSDGREGGLPSPPPAGVGPGRSFVKPALIGIGVLAVALVAGSLLGGGDDPRDDTTGGAGGFPDRGSEAPDPAVASSTGGNDGAGDGSLDGNGDSGSGLGDGGTQAGGIQPAGTDSTGNPSAGPPSTGNGSETPGDPGPVRTGDEADFEYKARLAYLELGDEVLTSEERAARLRALSAAYAGTDIATDAIAEAERLESGVIQAEQAATALAEARSEALALLRTAAELEASPFHPGTSLRAMRLLPVPLELAQDGVFLERRRALVEEVLRKGLERGEAAWEAADAAEALGDFKSTQETLRDFLAATDLPSPEEAPELLGEGAPPSLDAFVELAARFRERLASMAGREAEYEAERRQRERITIGRTLGARLEASLAQLALEGAAASVREAAALVSDEPLADRMRTSAEDLDLAQAAVAALIASWDSPGWRRRNVFDPRVRGTESVDVVGVAADAILLSGSEGPERVPLSSFAGETRELRALFYRRLERDWTAAESRGIATLLTVSATLEALRSLEPALGTAAKRIGQEGVDEALGAFDEALEWAAEDAALLELVSNHREAARQLGSALVARETGEWSTSAEMFRRLLEEQRDTWLVMLLSDGGKR